MSRYLIASLVDPNAKPRIEEIDITPANFHTLLNSVYHDSLVIDLDLAESLLPPYPSVLCIPFESLRGMHQQTSEKLILKNMGLAGQGVFLKPGASLVPEKDLLIYSGLYIPYTQAFTRESDKGFSFSHEGQKILLMGDGQTVGYFQHLPESGTVPEDLNHAAVSSFDKVSQFVDIDGLRLPLRCLVPNASIQASESPKLLGFDYGATYWLARATAPLFFDEAGEALKHQPFLLALRGKRAGLTLAYATEKAARRVCEQKYFISGEEKILFERIEKFDAKARLILIDCQ